MTATTTDTPPPAEALPPAAADHGHHTATGVDSTKMAMWAFLGSECLFFGALITSYLLYRGHTGKGPTPFELYDIPYTSVSSFVLLMSSLTMVLALAAIQRGDQRRLRVWLLATALLGSVFIGGQIYEFTGFVREGLKIHTSPFGSAFFTLTGFHGAHVTVGIIWLLSLVGMSLRGQIPQEKAQTIEIAGLYWHFVDVVWVVIFTVVYLVPKMSGAPMTTAELEAGPAGAHVDAEHTTEHHPLPYQYVLVAVFLAFVTGAEVGLYYIKMNKGLFVAILMVMMLVKFATVASWFMHLRFDSRIFRRLFVTGIVLALLVYFAVLLTFHVLIG